MFVEFSDGGAKAKLNTVCDPLPVKLAIVASPDTIVPTLSKEPINTPVLVSRTYLYWVPAGCQISPVATLPELLRIIGLACAVLPALFVYVGAGVVVPAV